MNIQFSKLAISALLAVLVAFGGIDTAAQTRPVSAKPKPNKRIKPKASSIPAAEVPAKPLLFPQIAKESGPVSIVNLAEPDYLSGEARVTVNPKQPTVIRLGLAQNAVSIVEFPASDGIYYIHEGNPKLASVFQSPTKETDRSITIYPGESFLPSRDGSSASSISLQMRSGLVLILELVPVTELRKNAHRCVITYDRDAVISARRTVGLAFDLGGDGGSLAPMNSRAVSKLIGLLPAADRVSIGTSPDRDPPPTTSFADLGNRKAVRTKGSEKRKTADEISVLANKKLAEAIRDPKKHLSQSSKPQNGLELAVSSVTELDPESRLVVIAVRNITVANLRLVPGTPELQVQTTDAADNAIQMTRIEARHTESTTLEGLVQPGSTAYFALVYKSPILGTNQSIRVLVAHREAADAPLTSVLGSTQEKE